ncbi:LOW QUALITY PROTEIN: protein suppressor 2 of zeste-like [Nilaparvata lugens]|uniref:LOW QUALITY PROTEIN: protein suppressor 2 of zeste-like n=2 Tax=Nilaparvata lugens TaxID=108931 RepID=UPI00193D2428|nr:LOW QUALITY PROTEIN: protein suppressor 2 of zeste-like [Nilaparvata lugens]
MVGHGGRVKLTEVNPHLVCVLCRGYLIDATTITECLHSFCRSCIILYLETKSYCPICEVQIHKTKPYLNLKLDKTLQDIVYKLVPGLFHSEMRRRQEFYKKHPVHDLHLHPEARGVAIDRLIYSPDDSISLSLEYYDMEREREEWTSVAADACEHASKRASSRANIAANGAKTETLITATAGSDKAKHEQDHIQVVEPCKKRYLLCPAVVTMLHLKKFVRNKYNLPDTSNVEIIYRRESLPDSYSLMDIAYIYTWKQNEPMKFYYRIHLVKTVRSLPDEEHVIKSECVKRESVPLRSDIVKNVKEEKVKVNGSTKSIKHETIDSRLKKPVKVEIPIKTNKGSEEAYSLDEVEDVDKSTSAVPNLVKTRIPLNKKDTALTNGSADKSNTDSPKTELNQQDAQNMKSKFYQDPSRNILPYKSKARSTVPSEHFPTKPYQRPRVSNSKNKVPNGSPHTSKSSSKAAKNKPTEISPNRNVTLKMNFANTTVTRTIETSPTHENTVKNGQYATNPNKSVSVSPKSDEGSQKPSVAKQDNVKEQVAKCETDKSITSVQEIKPHVNPSPVTEPHTTSTTNNQISPESKQVSNKSQDVSNKSIHKQVTPLKIVVQQKTSPDKVTNKINLNESNKSEVQKPQDNNVAQRNNIPEDMKRSISLDKAAEELLSAVGLKPKNDSKEVFRKVDDIKEESSKENVSPEQQKIDKKESSDFSLAGFGIQRPFRSEHDEMSVNLLLSLSNGHTSNHHISTTTEPSACTTESTKKPAESDNLKLSSEQKSNSTESSDIKVTHVNKNSVVDSKIPVVSNNDSLEKEKCPIPTPVNGLKVTQNNDSNKKQETNMNNAQKSPELKTETKIEESNEIDRTPKLETNLTVNAKVLSYSRQKKISEEKTGLEKPVTHMPPLNTKNTETSQAVKESKTSVHFAKPHTKNTKDISKTVDLLLMKSLTASKEANAMKVSSTGTSQQANIPSSVSNPNVNVKCDAESSSCSKRDEATAKSIAALALTSLTGQNEVSSSGMSSPRRPWADAGENVQDSKVRMLKRKLNRPGDCDVHVSTATRDDGLSEAKRRKLVTPDVSIELLTGPINERTATKRPQADNNKPCPEKKTKMNIAESVNHDELRLSSVDHLSASSVRIEKVAQGHMNFPVALLSPTVSLRENVAGENRSGKSSPDVLRPITPKNLLAERCGTPDITIEKMSDKKLSVSPNATSLNRRNDDTSNSGGVVKTGKSSTNCSPTVVKAEAKTKPGLSSPPSSSAESFTSPVGQKKLMPKLIEINVPARSKTEVMMTDKKSQSQRTGLKMTTVRKEVPIGKQMTFVKKDCNGALDLSPASVPKSRPILPARVPPAFPSPPAGSVDMTYPAAALHLLQMQMQSRLLASQANNNMAAQRKDPELSKQLKDWVRNAVNCGALPPHPLMFGPLPQPQTQQQSSPQRPNGSLSTP